MEVSSNDKTDRYHLLSLVKQANRLQLINKLMEALLLYEEALTQLKTIDKYETDYQYLYTSIYRELAIIKFEKSSRRNQLRTLRETSQNLGYKDLVALSSGFILLSYLYEYDCMYCDMGKFFDCYYKLICESNETIKNRYNYRLLGEILLCLSTFAMGNTKQVLELMKKATKIVGDPLPYVKFKEDYLKHFTPYEKAEFDHWYRENVESIIQAQQETYEELSKLVQEIEPSKSNQLNTCYYNCRACKQQCCYDGVYLEQAEVETLTNLVQTEPFFKDIGENFIIPGDKRFTTSENQLKTAKVWNPDYPSDFPVHFTQTKCIFRLPSGECSLQRFATDNGFNPWKFKPKACWQFPLTVEKNKTNDDCQIKIKPPHTSLEREQDENNIGPEYPGYITYLPCMKVETEKLSKATKTKKWYDKYILEIEYIQLLNNKHNKNNKDSNEKDSEV